ncbi:MAG: carboxypeptidase regulatory-like domain-containing protein [Planctomycetota bacterium]|nr:MAG: carboxypeptidase regulatory-like domain-containing protein [Planctomycetota bacterium]
MNTVKTRLQRGLQLLRRDLLERERDQLSGLAVIAAGAGWKTLAGEVGVLLMGKKTAAALIVAGLLVLTALFARPLLRGGGGRASEPARADLAAAVAATGDAKAAQEDGDAATVAQRAPSDATATWSVSGHVLLDGVDAAGAELVGELLESRAEDARVVRSWTFRADERGDYVWRLEPPTTPFRLRWSARIPGAYSYPLQDDFVPGDEPAIDWVVQATANNCTLRGLVRDDAGAPLAGARVSVRGRTEFAATAGDGRFSIAVPSNESGATLHVVADGFGTYVHRRGQLEPGEFALEDFTLVRELVLRGRAVDPDGAPIAGARVCAMLPYDRGVSITAEDGAFELSGVDPRARDVNIRASAAGFAIAQIRVAGEAGSAGTVELRMERGARVSGRVLLPSGAPAEGVLVWANETGQASPQPDELHWTDADGTFAIEGLARGVRSLRLVRNDFVPGRARVVVPDDLSPIEGLELRLAIGRSIAGRVVRGDGAPVPWAYVVVEQAGVPEENVEWLGAGTHTNSDGRFRFGGVAEGALRFTVLKRGFARASAAPVPDASGEYVVTVGRAAALAVRFVDASTGAALHKVRVRVSQSFARSGDTPIGLPARWYRFTPITTKDGVWRVDAELQPDKAVCLDVEADGYAPARCDPVKTALDPDPAATTIALARSTLVRGSIELESDGAPIAGARVRAHWHPRELRAAATAETRFATTDAAGRFEFTNLPPGPVSLAVEPVGGLVSIDGPFDVLANTTTTRAIRLASIDGATIRGRLLDADGRGLVGERITASALGEVVGEKLRWDAETDADGAYAIRGLPPGDFHVSWVRSRGGESAFDLLELVHVDANQTREHDVRPTGSARIAGRIEADFALPELVVVRVVWVPEKPTHWALRARNAFAERGTFEIVGLPPGRYSAFAILSLADGRQADASSGFFEVAEGDAELAVVLRATVR